MSQVIPKINCTLSLQQSFTDDADDCHADCHADCIDIGASKMDDDTLHLKRNQIYLTSIDSGDSEDDFDEDDEEYSIPITNLLQLMAHSEEDIILNNHGYKKTEEKICDTLQGQILIAEIVKSTQNNSRAGPVGSFVAIKKIDKHLNDGKIGKDEDGMIHCISKDICKEAGILKHLTSSNAFVGEYIPKYVDFFQTETDYYLVTQYIEGITLKKFIEIAHSYIKCGKLEIKQYQKVCKFILWQLTVTLRFLHDIYHCCHLNLCTENIMLENVEFVRAKDGSIKIGTGICMKLCDFAVAEIFDVSNETPFKCCKSGLTVNNHQYQAPNQIDGAFYDSRAADMWALGMIFYQCMIGEPLYKAEDMWFYQDNGYWALQTDKLRKYMKREGLFCHFPSGGIELLLCLLSVEEEKRISAISVMQSNYFRSYLKIYHHQITKQINKDRKCLMKKLGKMNSFPYYQCV